MVTKKTFQEYSDKPQYIYDSNRVSELKRLNASSVETKDITDLAALLIRYQYPSDLMDISLSWGMSVNMLLSLARAAWEKGEWSGDANTAGSSWDATSDD